EEVGLVLVGRARQLVGVLRELLAVLGVERELALGLQQRALADLDTRARLPREEGPLQLVGVVLNLGGARLRGLGLGVGLLLGRLLRHGGLLLRGLARLVRAVASRRDRHGDADD